MEDTFIKAIDFIEKYWNRKLGAVIFSVTAFVGVLFLLGVIDITKINLLHLSIALFFSLIAFLIWYIFNKLPKTKKGRIGLILAIYVENENDEKKFKTDFIHKIDELINLGNFKNKFQILTYNSSISSKINAENFVEYSKKSKARTIVWGTLKKRKKNETDVYLLNLNMGVIHIPLPKDVSKKIAEIMNQILTKRVDIPLQNDYLNFELQADLLEKVCKYVVALVSFYSGDIDYSIQSFENLKKSFEYSPNYNTLTRKYQRQLSKIKNTLPFRLIEVYETKIDILFDKWYSTRDPAILIEWDKYLNNGLSLKPNDYSLTTGKTLCDFLIRKDINGAIKKLSLFEKVKDPMWAYSRAFLYAYKGELDSALKDYNKAFELSNYVRRFTLKNSEGRNEEYFIPDKTAIQIEEFITDIISSEPQKYWLYFCLGLINQFDKFDSIAAIQNYRFFIDQCHDEKYFEYRDIANQNIVDLETDEP